MNERERLVKMLEKAEEKAEAYLRENDHSYHIPTLKEICGVYADYLLANGVIVPPCKVGDTVYSLVDEITQVFEGRVYAIEITEYGTVYRFTRKGYYTGGCTEKAIGKTVFLTREEAEAALAVKKEDEGK